MPHRQSCEVDPNFTIYLKEVKTMSSNCINWFGLQEADATKVLLLHKIDNLAAVNTHSNTKHKQKCITDYFG